MSYIVYVLPCNLTEAPIWEGDEDRRSREKVEEHILADPVDLISSWFAKKKESQTLKAIEPNLLPGGR